MENKDLEKNKDEILNEMMTGIKEGDPETFIEAQKNLAESIKNDIMKDFREIRNQELTDKVKQERGLNTLTAEEKKFYNEVISEDGFENVEELVPATVFERVFEELEEEHELLNAIDFVNTTGVTEWITRDKDATAAWWGKLTDKIEKELEAAFGKIDTKLNKLSVYLPVPKSMLDLGPEWLDRFVRAMLYESMALALEDAIINGSGIDNEPIGMRKDIEGSIDQQTGYPDKEKEELISLKPAPLGQKVMAPLTNDGKRRVNEVIMVVNPLDYWKRIFPQTTVLTDQGAYVGGVMPIPANIIQSTAVDEGEMIVGLADNYFMGIGSEQRIESSEHYKFLEDEMTYLAKQYANGQPLDNTSFLLFDISNMEPVGDLQLADLTLGSLTLEPEFASDIYTYTTETSDASNNIKATPKDADATISIFVNGTPHENDTSATWEQDADNEVEIYIIKGDKATKYEVTVTHSA
jgi:hypothetical protein